VHILTKIFVVLVAVLAIGLVPLVVVNVTNQSTYRSKFLDTDASLRTVRQQLDSERLAHQGEVTSLNGSLEAIRSQAGDLEVAAQSAQAHAQQLQSELQLARSMSEGQSATTRTLAKSLQTNSDLNTVLVDDLRMLRMRALTAERQKVELDEALRDISTQLQVAVAARRALEEELQRLTDDQQLSSARISEYVARYGALEEDAPLGLDDGIAPDQNLVATVIDVERGGERTLVEIDAGTRDGVHEGWVMTIGQDGTFIGKLRIIDVDINRAVGVLTLESEGRGLAVRGDRAYAVAGQG
jgi:cell shape-determining protein MreC